MFRRLGGLQFGVCCNGGGWQWWQESALIRNSQGNKGRSQKQLGGFKYINWEQSKKKLDYLSEKQKKQD